ncbi:MAG: PEP-CTERM sorting domain-containing protein, partial [Planctomycetota bacterium]
VASGDVDLSGTEVGFRQRIFGNNDIDTNYDNFNVDIVPEPGSLTLASLGALLCLRRRRK